jgi:hypothetical protein
VGITGGNQTGIIRYVQGGLFPELRLKTEQLDQIIQAAMLFKD